MTTATKYAKSITYRDVLDQLALWAESDANRWAEDALAELFERFGRPVDPIPTGRFSLIWQNPITGGRVLVASGKTWQQAKRAAEKELAVASVGELEIVREYA